MRKKLKFGFTAAWICTCLIVFAACSAASNASKDNSSSLKSQDAIAEVIKEHPDFPVDPKETVVKELPIGGAKDSKVKVKFNTQVEASGENTYLVYLTKDWGITVNGTYVKSYWKYKVTDTKVELVEKVDNENLPNLIK